MKKFLILFLLLPLFALSQTYDGTYFVSTNNSTTATLTANSVFTGTSDDVRRFAVATITIFVDQASATDGLSIQQSTDNSNWDHRDLYTVPLMTTGQGRTFAAQIVARYLRVVYTNGGTGQAAFRMQVTYKTYEQATSSIRPGDAMSNEADMRQVASYLFGFNGTTFDRLRTTGTGSLNVSVQNSTLAVTQSGNFTVQPLTNSSIVKAQLQDNSGNALNSTSNALNVSVQNSTLAVTQSGNFTVQPLTNSSIIKIG